LKLQITNGRRIRDLLKSLQSSRREGELLLNGAPVGRSGVIVGRGGFLLSDPVPADTLRIEGWAALYEIPLRQAEKGFRYPRSVLCSAVRRDRRLRPDGKVELGARVGDIDVELIDLSWRGARIREAPLRLEQLVIRIDGEDYEVEAEPIWREGNEIGLRIHPDEDFAEAVGDLLHPNSTSIRPSPQALWEALRSWYFQIRGPGKTSFAKIHRDWTSVLSRKLLRGDNAHIVLHDGHWATVSIARLYSGGWVAHQLGSLRQMREVDLGASEKIKRDIYEHVLERTQMTMGDTPWWLVASCRSANWLTRHWDFVRTIEGLGGVNLSILPVEIPTQVFLKDLDRRTDCAVSRIDEDPDAMALFFESLERTRPLAWREAFDLVPERYDLAESRANLGRDGLEIARRTFFASDGDRPLVAMILEISTRGMNAFRLFDSVRFVELEPSLSDEDLDRARHALTVAAYDFFRGDRDVLDDGRRDYFVVNIEESGRVGIPKFLQHFEKHAPLGHGFSWVIPSTAIPAFLERIWESTPRATDAPIPQAKDASDDHCRPHDAHPLWRLDTPGAPPEPGRRRTDADPSRPRSGEVAG